MAIIPNESGKNVVIDTPQRRKTRKLTMVLVAVAILIAGVIYFGFLRGPASVPVGMNGEAILSGTEQGGQGDNLLGLLGAATLDNSVFMDKKFQSLILSDRLPVVSGEKGRENPFLPF